MNKLLHTLIRTSLAAKESDWATKARQQLSAATEMEWQETIETLALHRLLPVVFYAVKTHSLIDAVPQPYLAQLQEEYHQTYIKNKLLLLSLDGILKVMKARDLHPVLWKGIVLADSFYPDLGMRSMGDIDFAIASHEINTVTATFKTLGFLPQENKETEEALYFVNQMGVFCDVHHRVRLFEGKESMNLTLDLKPHHMNSPVLKVLEPNAMLVHLIFHMDGHRDETGYLLSWILDVAFVLRKWGDLLNLEQIEQLMPGKEHVISMFRILRFLEQELGQKLPDSLAKKARNFKQLTLEEILRKRRLAIWELPSPRGWLRLGACKLAIWPRENRPYPYLSDLLLWPADSLLNL